MRPSVPLPGRQNREERKRRAATNRLTGLDSHRLHAWIQAQPPGRRESDRLAAERAAHELGFPVTQPNYAYARRRLGIESSQPRQEPRESREGAQVGALRLRATELSILLDRTRGELDRRGGEIDRLGGELARVEARLTRLERALGGVDQH